MQKTILIALASMIVLGIAGCGSGQPDMNSEEVKKAFAGEPMPPEAAEYIRKKQEESAKAAQEHAQQQLQGQ